MSIIWLGYCTTGLQYVIIQGNWGKVTQNLSVLFFQLHANLYFYKMKTFNFKNLFFDTRVLIENTLEKLRVQKIWKYPLRRERCKKH